MPKLKSIFNFKLDPQAALYKQPQIVNLGDSVNNVRNSIESIMKPLNIKDKLNIDFYY